MTKQIPLRIGKEELKQLEKIKLHCDEVTANKAITKVINQYMPMVELIRELQREKQDLTIQINQVKHHHKEMKAHEQRLGELLE